jgi:hypothetical protein
VLTGQSIAKGARYRTPRQRAQIAANWVRGGVYVQPTVTLAATVFGVSAKLVAEEVAKLQATTGTMPTAIEALWDSLNDTERHHFARARLGFVWKALESATA